MTQKAATELLEAGIEALFDAAFRTEDFDKAHELLQAARDQAGHAGDDVTLAAATDRLGLLFHYRIITAYLMNGIEIPAADVAAEEGCFRTALAVQRDVGDQEGAARSLFGLGLVFQVLRRDWDEAMPYFWQALDLIGYAEAAGDFYSCSEYHRHVGFYYLIESVQPSEAVRHLQLSYDFRERLGDPRRIPSALVALGEAELAAANPVRAVELLRRAVTTARESGLSANRIANAEETLREAEAAAATATATAED
jgi:tetratricopeptide (TPR) repeat protein